MAELNNSRSNINLFLVYNNCILTEPDLIEAVAQFDFQGRTERELSFKKGDVLIVYHQKSDDWWEGAFHGKEGLIPDKYVTMRHR